MNAMMPSVSGSSPCSSLVIGGSLVSSYNVIGGSLSSSHDPGACAVLCLKYSRNPSGNPGLSTGGSGDVIRGLVCPFYRLRPGWLGPSEESGPSS